MIIKTTQENWLTLTEGFVYGQLNDAIIGEVSEPPQFEYEELDDNYNDFIQLCCPPVFGKACPTINELKVVKAKVDKIGDRANSIKTMEGLDALYEVWSNPEDAPHESVIDRIDQLELIVLENEGVI